MVGGGPSAEQGTTGTASCTQPWCWDMVLRHCSAPSTVVLMDNIQDAVLLSKAVSRWTWGASLHLHQAPGPASASVPYPCICTWSSSLCLHQVLIPVSAPGPHPYVHTGSPFSPPCWVPILASTLSPHPRICTGASSCICTRFPSLHWH